MGTLIGYPLKKNKIFKSCGEGWVEAGADIAAHSRLDPEVYGQSYPHILLFFYFLKARRAVMGPAKRGPIWAG